jgi:hypothetical protein
MQSAEGPPRPPKLDYNHRRPALPRRTSRLISAPLQSTPPETGAALFRETRGKEKIRRPPFPLANDLAAVLAVKGALRRFAPLTAPGRREKDNLI